MSRLLKDVQDRQVSLANHLAGYCLYMIPDKAGNRLIGNAVRVYLRVKERGGSHDQQIAALLHDCVEDGNLSLDTIGNLFNENVQRIVNALTRAPEDDLTYHDYIKRVGQCDNAVLVKIADLEDNLSHNQHLLSDSHISRYKRAHAYLCQLLESRKRAQAADEAEEEE